MRLNLIWQLIKYALILSRYDKIIFIVLPDKFHEASDVLLDILVYGTAVVEVAQDLEKAIELLLVADGLVQAVDVLYAVDELAKDVGEHGDADEKDKSAEETLKGWDWVEVAEADGWKGGECKVNWT